MHAFSLGAFSRKFHAQSAIRIRPAARDVLKHPWLKTRAMVGVPALPKDVAVNFYKLCYKDASSSPA